MQSVRAFVHLYPLQFRKVFLMVSFKRMEETEDRRGGRRMGREKEGRRGGEETPATPLRMIGRLSAWVPSCHQVFLGKAGKLPVPVLLDCDSSLLWP